MWLPGLAPKGEVFCKRFFARDFLQIVECASARKRRVACHILSGGSSDKNVSLLIYHLDRMLLAGAPIARWINGLLLFIGALGLTGLFPARWLTAGLCLFLLISFFWLRRYWHRQEYVRFREETRPPVTPRPMIPSDSIPINASGYFTVEGKSERFTWLQGYFRTFATREHAVICLVQPKRFLLAEWPEKDVGMWYIFFYPKAIRDIRYGTVAFGRATQPCLAIEHEIHIPKSGRFRRERTVQETIMLASPTEADARRILADLLYDTHAKRDKPPPQPPPDPARNGHVTIPIGATRRLD